MSNKEFYSICITGVDGTGKSSLINKLCVLFPQEKVAIQYMGLKNWETKAAAFLYRNNSNILQKKFRRIVLLLELYKRVNKYKNKGKIVIFDRYVDEQYLQLKKYKGTFSTKILRKIYYYWLIKKFYQPTECFYLTCNIEDSIARKQDITSEENTRRLKVNKALMDEYYYKKRGVVVINTSDKNQEETFRIIMKELEEKEWFNSLMKKK